MGISSSSSRDGMGVGQVPSSPISSDSNGGNQSVSFPRGPLQQTSTSNNNQTPNNNSRQNKSKGDSSATRQNRNNTSRGPVTYAVGSRGRELFVDDILGLPEGTAQRTSAEELTGVVSTAIESTYGLLQSTHQISPDSVDEANVMTMSRIALERRLYLLLALQESLLGGMGVSNASRPGSKPKDDSEYKHELQVSRVISRCPVIVFTDKMLKTSAAGEGKENSEDRVTCVVCWEDYIVGDSLLMLPCFHQLHERCCRDWISRKCECPTCQTNIIDSFRRSIATGREDAAL